MVAAAIRSNSRVTIPELAKVIKVTERQVQRIIATLKKKAGLKRRGARKNGEWYFDAPDDENRTHKKYLLVRNEENRSVKRNISH